MKIVNFLCEKIDLSIYVSLVVKGKFVKALKSLKLL